MGEELCTMYVCKMHEASTKARTAKSRVKCSSLLLSHQDPEEGLRHPEHCPSGRWSKIWCHQLLLTQAHILKGPRTWGISKQMALLAWSGHFCGFPRCLASFSSGISYKCRRHGFSWALSSLLVSSPYTSSTPVTTNRRLCCTERLMNMSTP